MKEEDEHKQICEYIRRQYPKVIFNTDLSGIKLTMGQAVKVKNLRSHKGFPDIVIYKAVFDKLANNHYFGLFIELKRKGEKIYKKNGIPINEHVQEQILMIENLNKEGYYATICIGFDEAKKTIDYYLNL